MNILAVISWTLLESLDFAHMPFFPLSPNLHQSSVEQLKTHMGIDFCPEPCGLNSKRACQKSQQEGRVRERERKYERKTEGRTEISPNKHLTKNKVQA